MEQSFGAAPGEKGVKEDRKTIIYDLMNSTTVLVKDSTNELGFIILTSYPIV